MGLACQAPTPVHRFCRGLAVPNPVLMAKNCVSPAYPKQRCGRKNLLEPSEDFLPFTLIFRVGEQALRPRIIQLLELVRQSRIR
jgi:hypothetical protein